MLRIVRYDLDAHRVALHLQGRIDAEWAGLLERECDALSRFGSRVVLDLSEVVFIGRSGLEVLGRLGRDGVRFTGCSRLIAAMLVREGVPAANIRGDAKYGTFTGKRGVV